jgi:long-chain acyl-CoA synthetase
MTMNSLAGRPSMPIGDEAATWSGLLAERARIDGTAPAVSWFAGDGTLVTLDWASYHARAEAVAAALLRWNVRRQQTVAIIAPIRVEHLIAEHAVISIGATSVSMYETLSAEQLQHVIADAAPAVIIVSGLAASERIEALPWVRARRPHLVLLDGERDGWHAWDSLEESGQGHVDAQRTELAARAAGVRPSDVQTIVYTSGTTGMPKGVMLSHASLLSLTGNLIRAGILDYQYRNVGHLPLAHVAERLWSIYLPLRLGGHTLCCPDAKQLFDYYRVHRPTWLMAVPRTWDKIRRALDVAAASQRFSDRAAEIARDRETLREEWVARAGDLPVPAELRARVHAARQGVLKELRAEMGIDEAGYASTSAAPITDELRLAIGTYGIDVLVGYGLTETSGPVMLERAGRPVFGSVGTMLDDYEFSLAEDGEILLRGAAVCLGYRNRPDATAELIDAEGWLHTGDIGRIDERGSVYLTGRKKELIINASGKNISPTEVESHLQGHGFLDQVMVHGDERPYIVALITVDPAALRSFTGQAASTEELLGDDRVRAAIEAAVAEANTHVSRPEQIKRYAVLPVQWSHGSGELTPTLKLRRTVIQDKYRTTIDALYDAD